MATGEHVQPPQVPLWEVDDEAGHPIYRGSDLELADEIYRGLPPGSRLYPLTSGSDRRTNRVRLRSDAAKRLPALARFTSTWLDRRRNRPGDVRPRGRVW
jgi:hypothetical protein